MLSQQEKLASIKKTCEAAIKNMDINRRYLISNNLALSKVKKIATDGKEEVMTVEAINLCKFASKGHKG